MPSETEITICQAVDEWLFCQKQFASLTRRSYQDTMGHFVDSLPEDVKYVRQLTGENIAQYLNSLVNKGLKGQSINCYLSAVRSFSIWRTKQFDLPDVAEKFRMFRQAPPAQIILSEIEYHGILTACRNGERSIIQLLANTGLRTAELRSLQPENISRDGDFLNIVGKRNRKRSVPLNKITKRIVKETNFFNSLKSYRKTDNLYNLCRSLWHRNKELPHFSPHSFRHLFATKMLRRGCDIYSLARILGHKHITTTEQYLHFISDDLRGACDILDK